MKIGKEFKTTELLDEARRAEMREAGWQIAKIHRGQITWERPGINPKTGLRYAN